MKEREVSGEKETKDLLGAGIGLHAATDFLPANDETMLQASELGLPIKSHRQADLNTGIGQHFAVKKEDHSLDDPIVKKEDHSLADSIAKNGLRDVWTIPTLVAGELSSEVAGEATLRFLRESPCGTDLIEAEAPLDQHGRSGAVTSRPHIHANGPPKSRLSALGAVRHPKMGLGGPAIQRTRQKQREARSRFHTPRQHQNSSTDTLVFTLP